MFISALQCYECGPSWKLGFAVAVIRCIDIGVYHEATKRAYVKQKNNARRHDYARDSRACAFTCMYVDVQARWLIKLCTMVMNSNETLLLYVPCARAYMEFWTLQRDLYKNPFASVLTSVLSFAYLYVSNYNGKRMDAFIKREKSELRNFILNTRTRISKVT